MANKSDASARTKGSGEQVHLWRGQLLLLGAARRQHQRVGQELGSWWPGKLLRGGMWWLRRPIVHPIATLGLGTPQCRHAAYLGLPPWVRWPTTMGEAAIHHQHSIAGRPAGHLDGTIPQVPRAKWQVLGLGQGAGGSDDNSSNALLCLTSVPPGHVLSSQHSNVPKKGH